MSDNEDKPSSESPKASEPEARPAPRPRPSSETKQDVGVNIVVIMQSFGLIIFCALVLVILVMCHHRK